jgi:hypothetical protein
MTKPKPPDAPAMSQTAFRAPANTLAALDEWVDRLNQETHARWSRNSLLLAIIDRALRERADKGEAP